MSKELINEIESKIAWNDMNIEETSISLRDVKRLLNELEEQAERVEELKKVIGDLDENVAAFETLWLEEKRKNQRYEQALEFYAERDNYQWEVSYRPQQEIDCMVIDDGGHTARKALEGEE